eukprot:scaffold14143_cov129-Isochrysis_galbana.AAC.2
MRRVQRLPKGSCCTRIPSLEPELWLVVRQRPAVCSAKPGRGPGCRAGAQSYLGRALVVAVDADALGDLVRGRVDLDGLQPELARRHCTPPRARGVNTLTGSNWITGSVAAHPTVYGWLIRSRVGASSVSVKRAGSADPMGEEMAAASALRGLGCVFFVCCWCLAPKNGPQAPQDDAQDVRRRSVKGS